MTRVEWDGIWSVLSCKWTTSILDLLAENPHHFNELKRELDGVPASTVSTRLSQLESAELITRTVRSTKPPTVRYELTEDGGELVRLLDEIRSI